MKTEGCRCHKRLIFLILGIIWILAITIILIYPENPKNYYISLEIVKYLDPIAEFEVLVNPEWKAQMFSVCVCVCGRMLK